jgi:hypothetical protein
MKTVGQRFKSCSSSVLLVGFPRAITRGAACFLAMGLLMMAYTGTASAGLFAHGGPGVFCPPKEPLRDFGLSELPPVGEVPESAKQLGHGAVSIYGGWRRVMPESESFGYGFSEHSYTDAGVRLDWTVTAQLWTIDRYGTAFRKVDREKLFIGRLSAAHDPDIYLDPLNNRRGFYRFDMQIANKNGKVIGFYSAYFKVVRPSWNPRLQLERDVLRPGEQLLIRLENHGSEAVSYTEPFSVQRREGERWTRASELIRHRWLKWLRFMGPGGSSCSSLSLPIDVFPGIYRITKVVGTELWPEGEITRLTAPFEVIGSGVEIE